MNEGSWLEWFRLKTMQEQFSILRLSIPSRVRECTGGCVERPQDPGSDTGRGEESEREAPQVLAVQLSGHGSDAHDRAHCAERSTHERDTV